MPMGNTLVHSSPNNTPESFTVGELIGIFKKVLMNKEDGSYPMYEDIQEALRLFISHMRVINPTSASFIQSTLSKYNGSSSPGLQGYIQYIEKEIIVPLEKPLNTQSAAIVATIVRCHHIVSLGQTIKENNHSLTTLQEIQRELEGFLREAETLEDINTLKSKQVEIQNLIDHVMACLNNARILHSNLIDKE